MGTTLKHAPKRWSGEISDAPSVDDERPSRAVAAEDVFDDPSILNELNEATASLAVRRHTRPAVRVSARLPAVDAFDFAAACHANDLEGAHGAVESEEAHRAKSLASKLGPPSHDPGPKRRWWRFANSREDRSAEWRNPPPYGQAATGGRRVVLWSVCAALTFIVAAPVVFGSFRPLNQAPPAPVSDVRTNDEANTGSIAQGVHDGPVADNKDAADRLLNQTVVVRNQLAAASITAPATTVFAAPLVRPASTEGDSNAVTSPVDTGPAARTFDATATKQPPVETVSEAVPPAAEAASTAVADDDDFTRMAQTQLSVNTSPSQVEVPEATPAELTEAPPADGPQLSAEEIDRLLARGEDLLRSGDIASARLVFLHVAAAGDRRGAKAVGMTYDPKVYAHLPVMGITPDLEQAELWYGKAGGELSYTIDLTSAQAAESPEDEALRQWNSACASKYRSFDPSTGLYIGRSGTKRRCQLP